MEIAYKIPFPQICINLKTKVLFFKSKVEVSHTMFFYLLFLLWRLKLNCWGRDVSTDLWLPVSVIARPFRALATKKRSVLAVRMLTGILDSTVDSLMFRTTVHYLISHISYISELWIKQIESRFWPLDIQLSLWIKLRETLCKEKVFNVVTSNCPEFNVSILLLRRIWHSRRKFNLENSIEPYCYKWS